jgi:hypothetical protein
LGSHPRERGHHDAVFQLKSAEPQRGEQRGIWHGKAAPFEAVETNCEFTRHVISIGAIPVRGATGFLDGTDLDDHLNGKSQKTCDNVPKPSGQNAASYTRKSEGGEIEGDYGPK